MSTSTTSFYSSNVTGFEKMDNWVEELEKLEDSTCVYWINKGFRSKKYVCHRGPDTYVSKARTNDDSSRPVQKNSKKIGCNAIIMMTSRISGPSIVEFTRKNNHNHTLGFYSDLQLMSISGTLRDKIKNFLHKEFSRRKARSNLLQEMEGGEQQRNKMFHYDDAYNVWLMVTKDMFQFGKNEFESLQLWKRKLIDCGYKVIDHSLDNVFFYGFISSWQMDIMKASKCFSLDSTFGISSRSNEVLYSLAVRHPDTGKGVPVDCLLTNNHLNKSQSIVVFLKQMQSELLLEKIAVYNYAFFHVAQCWSRNLVKKIKSQPGQYSNTKVIRGNIMSELQPSMYETVRENVVEKLCQFREKWTSVQPKFVEYLKDRCFALEGYKNWSAAYLIEEHRNMRTNNYIESWHNHLKSVYLKRIKNSAKIKECVE
ncbi:hypothetical protein G6F43_004893 [Rhizopus delemar]|nr:hypothetical protein G6F43_004893 [Rhizopus delemar]